jgi:hypothetical protein
MEQFFYPGQFGAVKKILPHEVFPKKDDDGVGDLILVDKRLVIVETMRQTGSEKIHFILVKIHHLIAGVEFPIAFGDEDDLIHIMKMKRGSEMPLAIFFHDEAGVGIRRMMLKNAFHANRLFGQYSSIIAVFCIKNSIV